MPKTQPVGTRLEPKKKESFVKKCRRVKMTVSQVITMLIDKWLHE